ncbi:MAG: hypothetical protein R2769_04180 [Saprospiraceae bacterium]
MTEKWPEIPVLVSDMDGIDILKQKKFQGLDCNKERKPWRKSGNQNLPH